MPCYVLNSITQDKLYVQWTEYSVLPTRAGLLPKGGVQEYKDIPVEAPSPWPTDVGKIQKNHRIMLHHLLVPTGYFIMAELLLVRYGTQQGAGQGERKSHCRFSFVQALGHNRNTAPPLPMLRRPPARNDKGTPPAIRRLATLDTSDQSHSGAKFVYHDIVFGGPFFNFFFSLYFFFVYGRGKREAG